MNTRSLATAIYLSILVFSVLSLFFGDSGVIALQKMRDRQTALNANMADLDARHDELERILSSLRSDPEAVAIEARSLGLYRSDVGVVYFDGMKKTLVRHDAGQVLRLAVPTGTDDGFLRIIAAAVGLVSILTSLLMWKVRDARSAQ